MNHRTMRALAASATLLLPVAPALADTPYIGEIVHLPFTFCPVGYAAAEGQLLPISEYDALFSLIGTTYGGDGQTTFALPDLRARVPVHAGNGVVLGQAGGASEVQLAAANLPEHLHTATTTVTVQSVLMGTPTLATSTSPAANAIAQGARSESDKRSTTTVPQPAYAAVSPDSTMAADSVQSEATATTTLSPGPSTPTALPTRAPYLGGQYCVALEGVYPSRP